MRRAIVSLVVVMFIIPAAQGQDWRDQRIELIGSLGTTQLFGDIGGYTPGTNILGIKDIQLSQTRFNISLGGNYRFMQDLNGRINFTYGMFSSSDEKGSNVDRGFTSTTNFFEFTLMGEYYFIKNRVENLYNFSRKRSIRNRPGKMAGPIYRSGFLSRIDMYAFTGVGGISFSVKGNDALVDRGIEEGGFAMVLPVGLGAKYVYSPELSFGVELTGRLSFTDSLDGYTSDYSDHNDQYHFFNFTATYKLPTRTKFGRRR